MSSTNPKLVKFIKEARKRGFDDFQIKEPLLKNGWPHAEVERAFSFITPRYKFKNKVCIFLDSNVLNILEKRAKKNMFNLHEQIEDILRRSSINARGRKKEKLDDLLVSIFSRINRVKKK